MSSSDGGSEVIDTEPMSQKLYWLGQQHDGAVAFIVLSVSFVVLRFIGMRVASSKRKAMPFGWDDGLIIAALLGFLPLVIISIVNSDAYRYAYENETTLSDASLMATITTVYKCQWAFSMVYPIAVMLPKLSICFMYRKIFNIHVTTRRIVDGLIVFLIVNCIAWFVPTAVACRPISFLWGGAMEGKCINTDLFGVWIPFPHIVTDIIILVLPLPILIKTQLPLAKKIGLIITFVAGSTGLLGACIRFAKYIHRYYVVAPGLDQSTKSIAIDNIVSYVEPGMYLIAACLPSMRVLVRELHTTLSSGLSSFRERRRGSSSKGGSSGRSDSEGTPLGSADKHHHVPKVDMKLTGMGNITNMQSWAVVSQHVGEGTGHAAMRY